MSLRDRVDEAFHDHEEEEMLLRERIKALERRLAEVEPHNERLLARRCPRCGFHVGDPGIAGGGRKA